MPPRLTERSLYRELGDVICSRGGLNVEEVQVGFAPGILRLKERLAVLDPHGKRSKGHWLRPG